jgi:hypothetical protein
LAASVANRRETTPRQYVIVQVAQRGWKMNEAHERPRFVAAKLFFALTALCTLYGAVLFRRSAIGGGLTWEDYSNPLYLILLPKLIPFTASILSASFGLAYFAFEKKFKHPINITLAVIHLTLYLLAILGHETLVNFWWRVLGEEHATNLHLPLWASGLLVTAFPLCLFVFGVNILRSKSRAPLVARSSG